MVFVIHSLSVSEFYFTIVLSAVFYKVNLTVSLAYISIAAFRLVLAV